MNAMQLEVTRQLYLQLLSPITEAGERATFWGGNNSNVTT
jgi:hypothetical protein